MTQHKISKIWKNLNFSVIRVNSREKSQKNSYASGILELLFVYLREPPERPTAISEK